MNSSFKEKFSEDKRKEEAIRIREKYPERIPIIVETSQVKQYFSYSEKLPDLDKQKFLVPIDLTVGQFMYVLRKRLNLPAEKAMFMLIGEGKLIAPISENMSKIYDEYKDKDDFFLYSFLIGENTFGK